MRKKIVAGNWKMNLSLHEAESLTHEVASFMVQHGLPDSLEVIILPPFPFLLPVSNHILSVKKLHCGAQNVNAKEAGAFTGEVSVSMLQAVGATYVILGHSERRNLFGETDEGVHEKLRAALKGGISPIVCVGESLEERESGKHLDIIIRQLQAAFEGISEEEAGNSIIAYEPVWAIGTGRNASPEQAQEMHLAIRNWIADKYSKQMADSFSLLYGGSCKPSNASELFAQPDVDGGLIGGASLIAKDFIAIIEAMRAQS